MAWAAGAALSAFCLIQGLRKGSAGSAMTKARSPFWFWSSMGFFAVSAAISSYQTVAALFNFSA